MTPPLTLTEDSYRALAASSPWRWRTLHFTRSDWNAEAWVRRPGQMVVRFEGELHDYSDNLGPDEVRRLPVRYIGDTEPSLRPDGLVTGRPPRWPERDADDGALLEQDDPSFEDNLWVAMLDPIELASGTVIADLAEGELRGRRTWWATVDAGDAYEPRCTCCSLIWNEVMDRINCDERGEQFVPAAEGYPDGYRIGLDVQTGVVVSIGSVGQVTAPPAFEVTIHEVDGPVDVIDQVRARDAEGAGSRPAGPAQPGPSGWSAYPM